MSESSSIDAALQTTINFVNKNRDYVLFRNVAGFGVMRNDLWAAEKSESLAKSVWNVDDQKWDPVSHSN